jgi:hypothetical protein
VRGAVAVLRPCVDALERIARNHPASTVERRLGRARIELALALAAAGAQRAEVAPLAAEGAAWLRVAEGSASERAALERLAK